MFGRSLVHTIRSSTKTVLSSRHFATVVSSQSMTGKSHFAGAAFVPKDPIFALTAQYNADNFPKKVNLGQGTYRDGNGQPWVLPSVAKSRARLIEQGLLHEYLPILGLKEFRDAAVKTALGDGAYDRVKSKIATGQSVSGTGALHLAGACIKACSSTNRQVYIPEPTWANHHQVYTSLGFQCHKFEYYDASTKLIDMQAYIKMLNTVEENSIVILHACAHNPSGCDPTQDEWQQIGEIMKKRNLFPLFDAAYLGFNSGNIDNDAYAIRHFVNELGMEAAVCLSFAKNMGLYGERVGCVFFVTADKSVAENVESQMEMLQRSVISNPPAFGAKIASTILNDQELRRIWYDDLTTMSGRIKSMREKLHGWLGHYAGNHNWDHLLRQSGMFGFLGLSSSVVQDLKDRFHIYMAANSRISIAGLNESNVEYVAQSIAHSLQDGRTRPISQNHDTDSDVNVEARL